MSQVARDWNFDRAEHGTRARYVAGCRCNECRKANRRRHRERQRAIRDAAEDVRPSGPPSRGTLIRGGRVFSILRCPGANGESCVRKPATWLRGQKVCTACVERATIWDGFVPPFRAREHLLRLREAGVGKQAVSDACDVSLSALARILASDGPIRASTERRILSVDGDAIADGALVDAAETNRRIRALRKRGFTLKHLAELLGCGPSTQLQIGHTRQVTARTRARVARLWRQVERGELAPQRVLVDGAEELAFLLELLRHGVPAQWLSDRVGFRVLQSYCRKRRRLRPRNAEAVRRFRVGLDEHVRRGALPAEWETPAAAARGIAQAFEMPAKWLLRGER